MFCPLSFHYADSLKSNKFAFTIIEEPPNVKTSSGVITLSECNLICL